MEDFHTCPAFPRASRDYLPSILLIEQAGFAERFPMQDECMALHAAAAALAPLLHPYRLRKLLPQELCVRFAARKRAEGAGIGTAHPPEAFFAGAAFWLRCMDDAYFAIEASIRTGTDIRLPAAA